MNDHQESRYGSDEHHRYAIRIKGHLSHPWANWFDDVAVVYTNDGETILTCSVVDQSALHGLLKRVRDLGLELLSVNRLEDK